MNGDLTHRLRAYASIPGDGLSLAEEAADEIDRLRAQIAQARGHLGGYILQETQDGGSPDPKVAAADDALSRGSQGAAEPSDEHVPEWVPSGEGNLVCRVCGGEYGAPHNEGDI